MAEKVTVNFVNGQTREYDKGTDLLTICQGLEECYSTPVVVASVNNKLKDLRAKIKEDCSIRFYDLHSGEGMKVFERSLAFIMMTAAFELFPNGETTVEHSLSKGLYCELHLGRPITESDVQALAARMRQIVAEDRPFVRKVMTREEAKQLYASAGQSPKVKILDQVSVDLVAVYYCGDCYSYFYGPLAPSTGLMKVFELKFVESGFILRMPQKENVAVLPEYVEQPKLAKIFLEAEQWGKILRCGYVGTLNEYVRDEKVDDIIRVAEALHEKKLAQIADYICENREKARIITIAGPSSSGKTTFAQRLGVQMRVNGLRPVPISLDDYFVDRHLTPRDENGDFDFEAIEALDLELFNEHLLRILQGEEVKIPTYNFMTGKREYRGHVIKIEPDQPLVIEGIHGLNERLTESVSKDHKIKIYISAITQLGIDNHNRIPTTDTRLIRRIVRDSQFRAHDALQTLQIWPSVRRGEERNIFPFQEEADVMFNSALIYELGVLKVYAEPLLTAVTPETHEYQEAQRLLDLLSYFKPINDADIPHNSLLREFLGKSCFYR